MCILARVGRKNNFTQDHLNQVRVQRKDVGDSSKHKKEIL